MTFNKFYIFIIIAFFICKFSFSQKISVSLKNNTLEEAFLKIEKETDVFFYYNKDWFVNSTINKSYSNITVNSLLTDLLSSTSFNYYIKAKNVYITKNSILKNSIPENYFQKEKVESENDNSPIFIKGAIKNQQVDRDIIVVGKEANDINQNNTFIISGFIKNKANNKPIKGLSINIDENKIQTSTNDKGYYSFKTTYGLHVIRTKHPLFQDSKKSIIVYGSGTINLLIANKAVSLDEIVINSGKNDNIKKAAVGVTKIDIKNVKIVPLIFGERDILKVATTMPGIKTAGEGSLGFNVRGGKTDQNLIKLDNAVMYNPSHFFGVFSAINPYTSGKVSIFKGSVPAEFGGRLSSVIDISTKPIDKEKFSGQGNIGIITANLMIETPIIKDKTAVLVGYRTTYSNWILKKVPDDNIKNSKVSFSDAIVRLESKINAKSNIKATAYYSVDKFKISSDSTYQYSNRLASIEYNNNINKNNKLNIQINNTNYNFNIKNEGITNKNFEMSFDINETQIKAKLDYLFNKKHKFTYGISSKLYNINPGNIIPLDSESIIEAKTIQKEKALESALFIEDNIKFNKKLKVNIGLRYSYYAFLGESTQHKYDPNLPLSEENIIETVQYKNNEVVKTYNTPEYRFSVSYMLSHSLSVKGGYNNAAQYVHTLSTNTTASPIDSWKLSNLNIKPQKLEQVSIGVFKNLQDDNYEISVETYYKKFKNMLDFKIGAELALNENIETEILNGRGKAYGVEFFLKKKYGKLNGWLSYSYSKSLLQLDYISESNKVNNGDYFPTNFDKPHDFSLIANYKLTKRYSFSCNFVYQTGRPITYPIGKYNYAGIEHVLYSDRNKFRIPDYYRLDLGVNIEGNHKIKKLAHSFWNISVYNVLGRNNPYSIYFVNEDGQINAYKKSIFSIPIPTISYNFKF